MHPESLNYLLSLFVSFSKAHSVESLFIHSLMELIEAERTRQYPGLFPSTHFADLEHKKTQQAIDTGTVPYPEIQLWC